MEESLTSICVLWGENLDSGGGRSVSILLVFDSVGKVS